MRAALAVSPGRAGSWLPSLLKETLWFPVVAPVGAVGIPAVLCRDFQGVWEGAGGA